MERVLALVGLSAIAVLIIILVKKIDDYYDDQNTGTEISDKIFQAARAFAEGKAEGEIRSILLNCIDFYEEDVDEVLYASKQYRNDRDGGYEGFLKAARKILINY